MSLSVLFALLACRAEPRRLVDTRPGSNVLLVVLDTVRADSLGAYGRPGSLTPIFDSLATQGVLFERAYANAPWTLPSHASLFTGELATTHGATQEHLVLDEAATTMAEVFRAAGYATYAASANPVVGDQHGLSQGFDRFDETWRAATKTKLDPIDRHTNRAGLAAFLDELPPDTPFFGFVNYVDAHLPYVPPEDFARRAVDGDRFDGLQLLAATRLKRKDHYLMEDGLPTEAMTLLGQLYDGEVAFVDALVGDLLSLLDELELSGETLLVVTSDHGEQLGEGGHLGDAFSLRNELLHVPLLIVAPGDEDVPRRRTELVQLVDVLPTVASFCGVEVPAALAGRDLFAAGADRAEVPAIATYGWPAHALAAFSDGELAATLPRLEPHLHRLVTIQDAHQKLTWSSQGRHERVVLDQRGRQRSDSFEPSTGFDGPLAGLLLDARAPLLDRDEPRPADLVRPARDPELHEALEALGYVGE